MRVWTVSFRMLLGQAVDSTVDSSLPRLEISTVTAPAIPAADADCELVAVMIARVETTRAQYASVVVGTCHAMVAGFTLSKDMPAWMSLCCCGILRTFFNTLGILQLVGGCVSIGKEYLQVICPIIRKGAKKDVEQSISCRRVVAVRKSGRMVTEGFTESALQVGEHFMEFADLLGSEFL